MHSKHKVARELSARAEGSREAAKNERKQRKGHPRRHRGPGDEGGVFSANVWVARRGQVSEISIFKTINPTR